MAPGSVRNSKKYIPNNSRQSLLSHLTMTNTLADSIPRRSITRQFEKTNVGPEKANEGLETGKANNDSSIGGETTITTHTLEGDNTTHVVSSTQSPQTQQNESSSLDTPSTEGTLNPPLPQASSCSSKKKRGQTMGKSIIKTFEASGKKMKITVDPMIGRPKNRVESAKFSSQIGVVTRDVLPVPKKWKDVDEKGLEPGIDHIKIHMDVNLEDTGVKRCVIDRLQSSTRQKRYRLHQHYKKYSSLEEAKNNKPSFCANKQNWEELCEHFASPKFKSQKELNGGPCDMLELYKRTHYTDKGGWSSKEAEENWDLMIARREKYTEQGVEKSEQDILLEVLGHGSGYIKGYGYGPRPPSRRSSYDLNSQKEKELQDTHEKLQKSESEVIELKEQVSNLKDQLSHQGADIAKIMASMAASGTSL